MATLEQDLAWAEQNQASYRPSPEIQTALGETTLTLLIGPSSVGKSYLIHKVTSKDAEFSEASSITTRARRPDDAPNYRTDALKEDLLVKIKECSLVQYAVHPASKEMYASDLASYPTKFILLPALASRVGDFKELGFKKVIPVGLLASAEDWKERLKARVGSKDFASRIAEARESLAWIQANSDSIIVLENKTGEDETTADKIIKISKGQAVETLSSEEINKLILGITAVINAIAGASDD